MFVTIFLIIHKPQINIQHVKHYPEPIPEEIAGLGSSIVDSTINIYDMITSQLLPTPKKSHYTFNLRDLSKVFQGMLMMDIKSIEVSCWVTCCWEFLQGCHLTWKNLEFDNLSKNNLESEKFWKKLEKPGIFNVFSRKVLIWHKNSITKIKIFCHHQKYFFKNTSKVTLQYLFNVFVLFSPVSYLKLNFKLKIDPKMGTFNNLEKILKKRVATLFLECETS